MSSILDTQSQLTLDGGSPGGTAGRDHQEGYQKKWLEFSFPCLEASLRHPGWAKGVHPGWLWPLPCHWSFGVTLLPVPQFVESRDRLLWLDTFPRGSVGQPWPLCDYILLSLSDRSHTKFLFTNRWHRSWLSMLQREIDFPQAELRNWNNFEWTSLGCSWLQESVFPPPYQLWESRQYRVARLSRLEWIIGRTCTQELQWNQPVWPHNARSRMDEATQVWISNGRIMGC